MTREEAVARIKNYIEIHRYHERNAVKIFEALDMAIKALEQPEIVRCEDCIYWWESHKMCKRNKDKNYNCSCMDCDADFYCKNGIRREDECD